MDFYETAKKQGDFESGIRTALQAILASPHFVFRMEQRPANVRPGQNYRISDLELASRLSYFLWSTAPDDALITAAGAGRLHDPAELERQVRRMLADPRSESLSTRFATQWLRLAEVDNIVPDALLYPNFDRVLARAMRRETELFFDSVVREDRGLLDLLTANYTFMEVLIGTPPPPPPPNVPAFDATDAVKDGRLLTVRERMEAHRANPACSSCHRLIDPIGLSLENFDVTGVRRIKDNGVLIDPTSVLFDGSPVNGPAGLRQAMLKYSEAFIGNLTENLLTYALGRKVQYFDMPAVRTITREAARNNNRFSSLVLGIVKSTPFQMSKAESN